MKTLLSLSISSVLWGTILASCAVKADVVKTDAAKDESQLKQEIQILRERVVEQDKKLERFRLYRSLATGLGTNAVRAPFGRFLLVRMGQQCLALRVTEHVKSSRPTDGDVSIYEWFLQNDGSMDFSKANVQKGGGEIFDYKNGVYQSAYIAAGSFPVLEWSSSDWIYFQRGATPVGGYAPGSKEDQRAKNMRMTFTEWVRIGDVKAQDKSLFWLSRAQVKQFADEARAK